MNIDLDEIERASLLLIQKKRIPLVKATKMLLENRIILEADRAIKESYWLQVAFLTCLNAGSRVFKGGVNCIVPDNIPNLLPLPGENFNDLLLGFEGFKGDNIAETPKILFGRVPISKNEVEVVCTDFSGGLNVFGSPNLKKNSRQGTMPFGSILASSFALFWAFEMNLKIAEKNYNKSFFFSLWENELIMEETMVDKKFRFPPKLWFVGLGHLGQAYIWTIGMMLPGRDFEIILQDFDTYKKGNFGPQIIGRETDIGRKKTRICADFLDSLGIKNRIFERKFNAFDQNDSELISEGFDILITGLDNIETRRNIARDRYQICLDGSTNDTLESFDSFTFRNITMYTQKPQEIWKEGNNEKAKNEKIRMYGMEFGECGEVIPGISTPFVGLFGASVLLSNLFKIVNGGNAVKSFSGRLRNVNSFDFT